jgi:hypothetical protein
MKIEWHPDEWPNHTFEPYDADRHGTSGVYVSIANCWRRNETNYQLCQRPYRDHSVLAIERGRRALHSALLEALPIVVEYRRSSKGRAIDRLVKRINEVLADQ